MHLITNLTPSSYYSNPILDQPLHLLLALAISIMIVAFILFLLKRMLLIIARLENSLNPCPRSYLSSPANDRVNDYRVSANRDIIQEDAVFDTSSRAY